jgi:RNA polymerase sigma-70 factor (ECF subfamily)
VEPNPAVVPKEGAREFATTHWTVVLSCGTGVAAPKAEAALSQLCRTYWRPIFTFICRHGYSMSDAQDLTQDFFLMVLKGDLLSYADPARGRFRSLLLKSLQNFLIDANRKQRARKRGGAIDFISWDEWLAEAPSQFSVPLHVIESWPAERIFDLRWAATVVEQALRRLGEECESHGRRRVFDALNGCLTADLSDRPYDELAASLGISISAVGRLVRRLRVRYRSLLREEVAQTVEMPSEIDQEIRYLCSALAAAEESK